MAFSGFLQIAVTIVLMVAIVPFLGTYMARVFQFQKTWFDPLFDPVERLVYKLGGVDPKEDMDWWTYARALLISNVAMFVPVFAILLLQGSLPFNPNGISGMTPDLALHTAISFLTNTNQQHYSGETGASHLTQMVCMQFLMFTSAATGLAVGIAFIRGILGRPMGNFYVDLTRSISRILMPISIVFAVVFLSQGVPQNLSAITEVKLTDPYTTVTNGKTETTTTQKLFTGPFASMESIKQLGENGGGSYAANSAHPYENPNPFTNLVQILLMLAIPTSFIYTFGIMAGNKKQGSVIFWTIFALFVVLVGVSATSEYLGNPTLNAILGTANPNFEGQEVRFGWSQTALFATSTTGTMTGAVNGMHDSLTPMALLVAIFNMFMQVIWGGQGTGLAYILVFMIIAVFLTGLMVGRTPEIFGRKIEKREVALASIIFLLQPIITKIPLAIALSIPGLLTLGNPLYHGMIEPFYEYVSAAANNGSGLGGLTSAVPWWNYTCALVLLLGRYIPILALLALAGGLQQKKPVPETPGTLRTDTPLFGAVTAGTILILGGLTLFPIAALGPLAEFFANLAGKTF
jgi:potassium-transporting ATPase potassium-binding subunit